LVIAGDRQPAAVHVLAHAINDHLGNVGKTITYIAPIAARPGGQTQSLGDLVDDMERSRVDLLMVLGGNPALTAPADVPFASALDKVPLRVHLGLYRDETSRLCHWHLPEAHYLEAWSDARAYDGAASIVQPLIEPLYQGRSAHEVLSLVGSSQVARGWQIVRDYWKAWWDSRNAAQEFEQFWQTALHDGVIANTRFAPKDVKIAGDWQQQLSRLAASAPASTAANSADLDLVFLADPTIYDGRFANNGWLQELPKPITQLTWGNAAIVSPATAARLALQSGDAVMVKGSLGSKMGPLVKALERSFPNPAAATQAAQG